VALWKQIVGASRREKHALAHAYLDSLPENVLVVDLRPRITYVNSAARQTLASMASGVGAAFGVTPDEVIGGSIHRFYPDPARLEAVLRDPETLPYEAVFALGGTALRTRINRLIDANQRHVGYLASWEKLPGRVSANPSAQCATSISPGQDVS